MAKQSHDKPVVVKENDELVELYPSSHQGQHDKHNRVKVGGQRLDKRSAQGVSGLPKKSGQGGKFTWGGPLPEEIPDDAPVALDKNDPNYVDEEEEEEADRQAASSVVETSRSGNSATTDVKV